jgi:hypothetical protein
MKGIMTIMRRFVNDDKVLGKNEGGDYCDCGGVGGGGRR